MYTSQSTYPRSPDTLSGFVQNVTLNMGVHDMHMPYSFPFVHLYVCVFVCACMCVGRGVGGSCPHFTSTHRVPLRVLLSRSRPLAPGFKTDPFSPGLSRSHCTGQPHMELCSWECNGEVEGGGVRPPQMPPPSC